LRWPQAGEFGWPSGGYTRCFDGCPVVEFDRTKRETGNWRITANPLIWGNSTPEIIVLGFSKGPTQAGALASSAHDEIAYKGSRGKVGTILNRIGLINCAPGPDLGHEVNRLIADQNGRFHFGSLIRCTVERNDGGAWKGSGGGMLDKFVATSFDNEISSNCTSQFLSSLPFKTKLFVMFGMGTKLGYVSESVALFRAARGGQGKWSKVRTGLKAAHVAHGRSRLPRGMPAPLSPEMRVLCAHRSSTVEPRGANRQNKCSSGVLDDIPW
jgi:hypothetical protein